MDEDGERYVPGDVVPLVATIDLTRLFVQVGSHGSTFRGQESAELSFEYEFADRRVSDEAALAVRHQTGPG